MPNLLTILLVLFESIWPFLKLDNSAVVTSQKQSDRIDMAYFEFKNDPNEFDVTVAMLANAVEIQYEEQKSSLEGKDLYLSIVDFIGKKYYPMLDRSIVQAVMEIESNYNPNAGNPSGAIGLMQIVPKWHRHRAEKYGLSDLWDPYTNILVGMDFLNESYQKYGNYQQALYTYNHSWNYVNYVLCRADQIRGGD